MMNKKGYRPQAIGYREVKKRKAKDSQSVEQLGRQKGKRLKAVG